MRRKMGIAAVSLGIALILASLALFLYNEWENQRAGTAAENTFQKVVDEIYEIPDVDVENENPDPYAEEDCELPLFYIDGVAYIGYISIPDVDRELPVTAEWSYDNLKLAPCRYSGSPVTYDFVICAHNYDRFFGPIKNLTEGAKVMFTAMDGRTWNYEVVYVGTYAPAAVEEMISGEYDLTLFTCTYSGRARVTVGCNLVDE